jgi:hypothetical protein
MSLKDPKLILCRTISERIPRWLHAKRAVCEPNCVLTAGELRKRLCEHFETKPLFNTFKIDGL